MGSSSLDLNITLVWKWVAVNNILAYYSMELITAVKVVIVQAPFLLITMELKSDLDIEQISLYKHQQTRDLGGCQGFLSEFLIR
jgi:hypothetical protein